MANVDRARVQALIEQLLTALGEDPSREGLKDTPRRVADFWVEFLDYQPGRLGTSFESIQADQMVVVSGMRVWSLCEHHLLPFWVDVTVGYIPAEAVLGLSKFARIAKQAGRRLGLQERLVAEIASAVKSACQTEDVAVMAVGEHLCMTMRGIETPHRMTSSSLHGRFRDPTVRAEFMALANAQHNIGGR